MPVSFIIRFIRKSGIPEVHGTIDENFNIDLSNYDLNYDILATSLGEDATPVLKVVDRIVERPLDYFFVQNQIMGDTNDLIICGLIRRSIELLEKEFGHENISQRIYPIEKSLEAFEHYYKSKKRSTGERSRAAEKAKRLLNKHIARVEQFRILHPKQTPNVDEDIVDLCLWYMADLISGMVKIHRPSTAYSAQQNAEIATLLKFRQAIHEYNKTTMSHHVLVSNRTNFLFILNRIIPPEDKDVALRASISKKCYDEVVGLAIQLLGKYQDAGIAKKPVIVDPLYHKSILDT